MARHDEQYLALIEDVLTNGIKKTDRTGTGTIAVNSRQMRFDLSDGSIPLLTTKKMFTRGMIHEILWYFRGLTNIKYLVDNNVHIWDEWVPFAEYGSARNFFDDVLEIELRPELYEGNLKSNQASTLDGVKGRYTPTVGGIGFLGSPKFDSEDQVLRNRLFTTWSKMIDRCYNTNHDKFAFYGGAGVTVCERWHDFSAFVQDVTKLPGYSLWKDNPSEYQLDKDYFGGQQYSPRHCVFLSRRDNKALAQTSGLKYKAVHEDGTVSEFVNITKWCEEKNLRVSSVHYAITESASHEHKGWTFTTEQPREGFVFRENIFKDDVSLLELGPVYGKMWRAWPDIQIVPREHAQDYEDRGYVTRAYVNSGRFQDSAVMSKEIDQLGDAIHTLRTNPDSRRIIINSWNPALLPTDLKNPAANPAMGLQALPPCHCMFQFTVLDGKLNCDLRQRSCDVGLGVPFNIAQYSIMTHIIAKMVGLQPGEFVWNGVDVHIYSNHVEQLKVHLSRGNMPYPDSPTVRISDEVVGLLPEQIESSHIEVVGYTTPYPKPLVMEVAV